MDHFIEQIEIKNFKSIRELTLTGFKRINLFIGRPNVGKSNLLESLSLFGINYLLDGSNALTDFVRVSNYRELFYEGNYQDGINISYILKGGKDEFICSVNFLSSQGSLLVKIENNEYNFKNDRNALSKVTYLLGRDFSFLKKSEEKMLIESIPKKYTFKIGTNYEDRYSSYLIPPYGSNLLSILESSKDLRKIYSRWFRQYNLSLVLDLSTQTIKIQKQKSEDEVFQLPYSSVADTLQRIIFYKTAIASNENSVLLFEEPEAHAYPPYISEFTQEVIGSKTNQTFIVTHSPLIVNDMLDNAIDDLAIFIVDFKDGQTVSRPLTQEELHEVRKFGVDLFFNGEAYPV